MSHPPLVVVMGVSAVGKSTLGHALGARLGIDFVDSDVLHPVANVEKMRAGVPLTDADREPWLDEVGRALANAAASGLVIACSSLKRAYRDRIRAEAPGTVFVHLVADVDVLARRIAERTGHFMPASLLDSQLATLEPLDADERGVVVDVAVPVADAVDRAIDGLRVLESSA